MWCGAALVVILTVPIDGMLVWWLLLVRVIVIVITATAVVKAC